MKRVFVVTFERLNPVFLGCYGSFAGRTPELDRLASQSVVFDQHFGENFDPRRASDGWWTGCYTFPRSLGEQQRLGSFLTELRRAGVATCLVCSPNVSGRAFAEKTFDTVHVLSRPLEQDEVGAEAVESVLQCWNEQRKHQAVLLWLALDGLPACVSESTDKEAEPLANQTAGRSEGSAGPDGVSDRNGTTHRADAAGPDDGRSGSSETLAHAAAGSGPDGVNDGEPDEDAWAPSGRLALDRLLGSVDSVERLARTLQHTDALVGRLRSELAEPAAAENAEGFLWVVAAAGGVEIPAATQFRGFRLLLNESVVRGLQLVWLPDRPELCGRVQQLVQTVDLGPTLLEWFGVGSSGPSEGRSWLPLLLGRSSEWRQFICLGAGLEEVAIRTADYYLVTDRWQLVGPQTPAGEAEGPATPAVGAEATPPESTDAVHDDPVALAELIEQAEKYCRLFVKPDDVWNVHDVAQQAPEDVLHLRRLLREFILSKQGDASGGGAVR